MDGWKTIHPFILGFGLFFRVPKPCWMLVFGLRLKPGWRYPQSCQEATKWAKNTGRSKWMKKKIWRDSMQRFHGGGGVCVFFFAFFFPHVVLWGFCLFCFCFFFGIFSNPPPKKGGAVAGGFLEETLDVERIGALLRVRCIFTIDHSWDPFFVAECCWFLGLMMGAWWPWEDGESDLSCWMEHFLMMMRLKYMGGTAWEHFVDAFSWFMEDWCELIYNSQQKNRDATVGGSEILHTRYG